VLLRDRITIFRSNVLSIPSWQSVRKTSFLSIKTNSLRFLERWRSDYALTQCHISGEPNSFPTFNPLKPNGKYTPCIVFIHNCCKYTPCIVFIHNCCKYTPCIVFIHNCCKYTLCIVFTHNCCNVKKLCILSMHLQCILCFITN